jgi:hypothetical protein
VAAPGTEFTYMRNGIGREGKKTIGSTGTYVFDDEALITNPLISITRISDSWGNGATITYGYYDNTTDDFSIIHDVIINDKIIQVIGKGINVNLISKLKDIRTATGAFHYIKIQPRDTKNVYYNNGQYYYGNNQEPIANFSPNTIYIIYNGFSNDNPSGKYLDGRDPSVQKNIKNLSFGFKIAGMEDT